MSQLYTNQISPVSPTGTVNFTGANPPTYNGTPLGTGGGGGGTGTGPLSGYEDPRPIESTPPAPTGLTATGAFKTVILSWALENFINFASVEIHRSSTNDLTTATNIGSTTTNGFNDANVTVGNTYYYWVRAVNIEGVAGPYNAGNTAGTEAALLTIGNTDLGPLVVEASNLASGAVDASKLADGAINAYTQFANGIEPIAVVSALPNPTGYTGPSTVFLTTDGKLYRYVSGAWTAAVLGSDVTGVLAPGQIPNLDASKLTTGTIDVSLLAANSLDATKFANGIEPITVVTSVPSVKSTTTIYNSTDGKLYTWNGTAYVTGVNASDVSGTLSDAQIASLNAAKLIGTINTAQLAANSIDATKFANSIEPVTIVTSVPSTKSTSTIFNTSDGKLYTWTGSAYATPSVSLSGTISGSQITDGTIAGTKFASGLEPITVVSSVPSTKSTSTIFNTTDGKLYKWNGTAYTASVLSSDLIGTINPSQIADGSIAGTKFASGVEPMTIVSSVPTTKLTSTIFNTTDSKVYTWNGTAYTSTVYASDITVGQITSTQISDGAITTPKMTAGSINANVLAAGTITTNLMTSNTINGDVIQANSLSAGKITAGSITATQIAANAITTTQIAANTITGGDIAANTITAGNIAAGTITGDKIAANTLTAGNISAGAISSTQIAAGGITATNLAASTITGNKIAANTITGSNIAAGTITATNIATDTITSGQIAAGAINTSELAAGAVTTNKLTVPSLSTALNPDPGFTDATAWGLGNAVTFTTVSDGVVGNVVARGANVGGGSTSSPVTQNPFIVIDPTKTYHVSVYARQNTSANGRFYFGLILHDASGNNIVGDGSYWYYAANGVILGNSFVQYTGAAGAGTAKPFPSNAKTMAVVALMNYGSTAGYSEIQDLRIEEYTSGSLIVDGTITTDKFQANSINGNVITAGTLNANALVAGSITTSNMTANSIGGTVIQDGTLNATKIITGSITSGQIQAGAISTSQLAAGSVSASKLTLTSTDSVFPDPSFADKAYWAGGTNPPASIAQVTSPGSWPVQYALRFLSGTGNFDFNSSSFPIELGASYRASVYIYVSSGTTGQISLNQKYPSQYYTSFGIPTSGTNSISGLPAINLAGITKNTWLNYVTVNTNSSSILTTDPNTVSNLRYSGNITAGSVYFAIQLVRAYAADLIVDGAITTSKMTANSINASVITAGTITPDKLVANSITAGQIQAGAIGASQIAVGGIQAQNLAITPSNLCLDSDFSGGIGLWNGFVQKLPNSNSAVPASCPTAYASQFNARDCIPTTWMTVTPGEIYRASLWCNKGTGSGGSGLGIVVHYMFTSGSYTGATLAYTSSSGWNRVTGTYTVPSGITAIRFGPWADRPTYTGESWYANMTVQRVNDASLIVDGTITATKLAANTIVAGSGVIANGAITNALIANLAVDSSKIADATITNAKIASLDASKITTGTLSASQIGAATISTDKLVVGSVSNIATGGFAGYSATSTSGYVDTPLISVISTTTTGRQLLGWTYGSVSATITSPSTVPYSALLTLNINITGSSGGASYVFMLNGRVAPFYVSGSGYYSASDNFSSSFIIQNSYVGVTNVGITGFAIFYDYSNTIIGTSSLTNIVAGMTVNLLELKV